MGKVLAPDDLDVGKYISVIQGSLIPVHRGTSFPTFDTTYNGVVMRILAIDFPYIVVEYYASNDILIRNTLDFRDMIYISLSDEFVKEAEPDFIKEE